MKTTRQLVRALLCAQSVLWSLLIIMPPAHAQQPASAAPETILFRNVRVFDGRHPELSAPSDVLVQGNKIERIAPTGSITSEASGKVIEGGGRTLMLEAVNRHLEAKGLRIATGTIVDATILHAPSSTKNKEGLRDPQMHQTRKGKQWYFGMKAHIGVDAKSGIVHSVCSTAANVADGHMLADLLHGEERKVWGAGGYQGQGEAIRAAAPHAQDMTCKRARYKGRVDELQRARNRSKSRVRAKVEHPFRVLKRIFGFEKVRYRGLAKNHNRLCACFALGNLYLHRKRLALTGA